MRRPGVSKIIFASVFAAIFFLGALSAANSSTDKLNHKPSIDSTIAEVQKNRISDTAVSVASVKAGDAQGVGILPPRLGAADYPKVKGINSRVAVWMAAQMHMWFAAFVLAVPVFVLIIEAYGTIKRDSRYDELAKEFMRVSITAYTFTLVTGIVLLSALLLFYPPVMKYLYSILKPTVFYYILFFIIENIVLYSYYLSWDKLSHGRAKLAHLCLGLTLNLAGTAIMFIANAWVTFMMTPGGIGPGGAFDGNVWHAINNHLWSPMNLHRIVANVAYGGSIVGAYAAYMFLGARSAKEREHYDWMGYTASVISICALLPLPFAGYWLTAEIYAYSQQMGINLMGGSFGSLFIIQAVVIGALFLAANYYLWCAMQRTVSGRRYAHYIKYIATALALCFMVWSTPHTPQMSVAEVRAVGGRFHPILAPLGLMPAKNIAVNVMIIATFLSFLLYRRSKYPMGRIESVYYKRRAAWGSAIQAALITAGVINIIAVGVYYGYFTNTVYKVVSSVAQVLTTFIVIIACLVIEKVVNMRRSGEPSYEVDEQGPMPEASQYALILIAVSFTWLMGLMGFVRAAIRGNWHVYSVLKDASPDAFTPPIAYASRITSIGTIIFMALIAFIFYLSRKRKA